MRQASGALSSGMCIGNRSAPKTVLYICHNWLEGSTMRVAAHMPKASSLAKAMLKFVEDPALLDRMGRRSRQMAEEKFDVHKVNAVMLKEMGLA